MKKTENKSNKKLVLTVGSLSTLCVAVLAGTYLLSTMATIIDSFIGAPSGHYSKTEITDTKLKAEALAAEVEAEGTVLVQNNDNTLPLNADTKKVNVFGWASTAWLGGGSGSGGVNAVNTDLLAALTATGPLGIDMYLPAIPQMAAEFGASEGAIMLSLMTFFLGLMAASWCMAHSVTNTAAAR